MKKIFLIATLLISTQANCQTSLGFILEARVKSISPEEGVDDYFNFGLSVKQSLTTDLNLVSGIGYRFLDADISNISRNTDMVTHFRDVHPNQLFHIVPGDYFRFSYITIPIGLEFKPTTFLRVQYNLDNNFLVGTEDSADEYLQYGKNSLARHMFSHSVFLSVHQNSAGLGFGVIFHPSIIRSDLNYTYEFMQDFQTAFKDSYFFNVRLWADFQFRKRKKVL
jgi:hypothetical protein